MSKNYPITILESKYPKLSNFRKRLATLSSQAGAGADGRLRIIHTTYLHPRKVQAAFASEDESF